MVGNIRDIHPEMQIRETTPVFPPMNITGRQQSTARTDIVASSIFGEIYFISQVQTKRIPTKANIPAM